MAFSAITSLGNAGVDTGGGNLVITTSAVAEAGRLVIVQLAKDNVATADGTGSEITSVVDSAGGNTWQSAGRFVNGQGAANAGAYVDLWYSVLTNEIASGGTITITKSTDVDCVANSYKVTLGAGNSVQVAGTVQTLANDAADPGSMTISGLTSKEYLFWRVVAAESEDTTALTPTTNYTARGQSISSTAGGSASNMRVSGETRILTGTGDTSNPTLFSADCASIYLAFEEVATGPTATLSKTLGAATLSANATVDVGATLSKTLSALALSAAATVDIAATLSKTLGNVASSAAAEVTSPGNSALDKTLGALTAAGVATVDIAATADKTLGTLAGAGNATVAVDATLAKTLGTLASSGNATVDVGATLAKTLGTLTLSATAEVADAASATATLNQTLASLAGAGVASVAVEATLAKTLGNVTGSVVATADISASVSKTLGTATLAAAAGVNVEAQLSKTLASLSISANANVGALAAVQAV